MTDKTQQWQTAGLIYTAAFVFVMILRFGQYGHLGLDKYAYGTLLTRWQALDVLSRTLIGWSAPSYIHYLIIGELVLYFVRRFLIGDQLLIDLWWKLLGLLLGYTLTRLPTPQQFYEDPTLTSPSNVYHLVRRDILSSQQPNPWGDQYSLDRLRRTLL